VGNRVQAPAWRLQGTRGSWGARLLLVCVWGGELPEPSGVLEWATARPPRGPSRARSFGAVLKGQLPAPGSARAGGTPRSRCKLEGETPGRSWDRRECGGRIKSEPRAQLRARRLGVGDFDLSHLGWLLNPGPARPSSPCRWESPPKGG
jgi:hypothetical protein